MDKAIGQTLFVIQWKSDNEIEVTTGYQIEAIKHSEQKWYDKSQVNILRKATQKDIENYKYVGEKFLCPKL